MTFSATKAPVYNRGAAPDAFLRELVAWGRSAPEELFAPNKVPVDIYTVIKSSLATPAEMDGLGVPLYRWDSMEQRRAAMLEAMRVHAGMESSWRWGEGVDTTNRRSMSNAVSEETGIFQVSFDSLNLGRGALKAFARERGIETPAKFIAAMKQDRALAIEYYARLSRVSVAWAGPLLRKGADSVYPWLRRSALAEFQALLA